ncbi:MAG: type IV pilus assembly protein PilM [Candidatus Omnitrophica bacterium]|nr:type IV pilus assembly protein PilM [Candidatus Omnitrophota bacterium]
MHKLLEQYFGTIRKFLPSEQKTSAVGLDIGTGECKLIELTKSESAYELVNWAIEPIKNGDANAAIKQVLSCLTVPCKSLYSSVFGKGTLIRYIDMPQMSIDDLKSSFDIEADKYFPFAQDQIYTDCYILDVKQKEKMMSVMAAAAKKELVDRRVKLLNDAGMPAEFIGLNPIALANVLNVLGLGDEEPKETKEDLTIALLDMGESVSSLTILVNKLPRFTRDIFVGGQDFTKSISNGLGISFQDAEKLKCDPQNQLEKVISACDTAIMNMTQELRLSMDYFATEKNHEIDLLLLTGGASMLQGIAEGFEKTLEVKVKKWDPVGALKVAPEASPEEMGNKSLKLGVALGLALYQYD